MPVTALEAFDLETRSWTRYPCIPSRRAFACCAASQRSLFSLGGLQQPGPHNFYSRPHFVSTMEEYDLDQGESASPRPRPQPGCSWCSPHKCHEQLMDRTSSPADTFLIGENKVNVTRNYVAYSAIKVHKSQTETA